MGNYHDLHLELQKTLVCSMDWNCKDKDNKYVGIKIGDYLIMIIM